MRGSRKHVLDWTSRPEFPTELCEMLQPIKLTIDDTSTWMPRGHDSPAEARLESFGPRALLQPELWSQLRSWWLKHEAGANTPNWDIAMSGVLEGRRGLVLVEAKANVPELSSAGKYRSKQPSERSRQNHERIAVALQEATIALGGAEAGVRLRHETHYQLSNRLAFAWRLASAGVPVVLVYLGFTGDTEIQNVGEPIRDDGHWRAVFLDHLAHVAPRTWLDSRIETNDAPFWLLARSRPVLAGSRHAT